MLGHDGVIRTYTHGGDSVCIAKVHVYLCSLSIETAAKQAWLKCDLGCHDLIFLLLGAAIPLVYILY